MTKPKLSPHDIAAAARLVMPEHLWNSVARVERYYESAWLSGLDGSDFYPERYGCDWLIQFVRSLGMKATMHLLRDIETIIREEYRSETLDL